jgi:aerobic-type carbon monoxide dehydrogenase small subunit (CoxS/CutS family)
MNPTSSDPAQRTKRVVLSVNGVSHELEIGDKPHQVAPSHTLADTLRNMLGHKGTKVGCNRGTCASCTVLMDGIPILSCMTLTVECDGAAITTIEGLQHAETGELDSLQQSFVDHTAFQCGFCTPGMIMASKALLEQNPSPDEQDVKEALAGHYCRCISHYHVIDAVLDSAGKRRSGR